MYVKVSVRVPTGNGRHPNGEIGDLVDYSQKRSQETNKRHFGTCRSQQKRCVFPAERKQTKGCCGFWNLYISSYREAYVAGAEALEGYGKQYAMTGQEESQRNLDLAPLISLL